MSGRDFVWWVPALAAFWLGLCALLSFVGGWHYLAARFGSEAPTAGERFRFRSAAIGWSAFPVNYRSCLFVTVGPGAFALSVSFPFLILHPRLVIPWSAVQRCEYVKSLLVKGVAVYISGFNRRLLFRGNIGDIIFAAWTRARPPEPPSANAARRGARWNEASNRRTDRRERPAGSRPSDAE